MFAVYVPDLTVPPIETSSAHFIALSLPSNPSANLLRSITSMMRLMSMYLANF